jgi:hypothetical protein
VSEIVPSEAMTPEAGRWVTLVPVEVFGGDCACHEEREGTQGQTDCHGFVYGLSDAVQAWSDCNRARGHVFRVDDVDPQYRLPGETVRVWVADKDLPLLLEKVWGEG